MRKRMTSLLLTLVMLLSLVPAMGVTALAASGDGSEGNPRVVTTYEDWKAAMQQSGETYIKLGADIDTSTMNNGFGLGKDEWIRVQTDIHLDLNGHKLTLLKSKLTSSDPSYLILVLKGSLTIEDSQSGGEIVGLHQVTNQRMQLIDVLDGAKLTLNSGKLHFEVNADSAEPNATIRFDGAVEINDGTVSIASEGVYEEASPYLIRQNFALEANRSNPKCHAVIKGGTFDGRVLLYAVAKASGTADNVITGGDFKKSIFIRKNKNVTGDVPLNVSIQGGTYHYAPGYRITSPTDPFPGKKESDPYYSLQFATDGFASEKNKNDVQYNVDFHNGTITKIYEGNYDINAFASMFPKNAIITAEGQTYEFYRASADLPGKIDLSDAVFTGAGNATDLEPLVNNHYKTITVTTLPEDALKDMKLTVGDGTPLPAQGTSTVSGDVTLGSGGTLTKNVYITAIGNKQLKEMYPSKIDFGYRLNISKDGTPVTDYTGDSLTFGSSGDTISISVQLRDFTFEEGVYTFDLRLYSYLRGSEAQIGKTLVGRWKLTAKEHEHNFGPWQIAGTGNVHFRNCSCGVQESKPHEWKYLEGQDKYKCTVCGYEKDGEKDRITYVYASPRSPIAGEHPGDYTAAEWVKIGGANYKVESIVWKNMDNTDVTTFESGKIYKGTVTFKADTGFAFDGDRIYASKIFDSSKAENVGDYTITDKGSTLTATFKLKDESGVRPGLNVKVKLPTLNDKIGQSLPAVELVDTTLPGNVELVYVVCEDSIFTGAAITDPNYRVKPNQTYNYMAMLKFKDGSDITNSFNVSYTVTDGGDAETYIDTLPEVGVLAMYQTPDTSKINVSVSGTVKSYNPNNPVTVQLIEQGHHEVAYETTIDPTTGSGQKEQSFSFDAVAAGTYDLVVTKPGHLTYTVKGVVVGGTAIDLTKHSNAAISTITLLCGDIDGNGFINSTDLGIILKGQNYGKSTATAGDKTADLDGNGFINSTDLGIVLQGQHYGKSAVSVSFAG